MLLAVLGRLIAAECLIAPSAGRLFARIGAALPYLRAGASGVHRRAIPYAQEEVYPQAARARDGEHGVEGDRPSMVRRGSTCAFALAAALMAALPGARAEDPKFPDWKGQWERFVV